MRGNDGHCRHRCALQPPPKKNAFRMPWFGSENRLGKKVRNANRNEPSRGRSLLHGPDTGNTQDHRSIIEQRLAVGGGWRLAAVGGWRLAVGGPGGLSLTKKKIGVLKDTPDPYFPKRSPTTYHAKSCCLAMSRADFQECTARALAPPAQSQEAILILATGYYGIGSPSGSVDHG